MSCRLHSSARVFVALAFLSLATVPVIFASQPVDAIKTTDTPRGFPKIQSRHQWKLRARAIREQILVSCGLWPLPTRTPLHPHIFGKILRDGYSIEKVYFQTYPGFYLAGNLYRPLGKGRGPFPGVLNPHGHWSDGRMEDTKDASVVARCITFARQGMVAFSYDMVGYHDTHFADPPPNTSFSERHSLFGARRTDQLWNISLMGLQTWNSIRALDFLALLPDVDPKRLACTGASGGATQTYILGAVDDRLAAQAPVCMVSHIMQGGCSCENSPGLRVEYSNMEIAAAAAPRPQILVGATGDWTKDLLTVEGPAVASIYRLLGAADHLRYVQFNFGHNYNQTSRNAVYEWFGHWLLKNPDPASLKEQPYQKEPDAELRVFPDDRLPEGALTLDAFDESLRAMHRAAWAKLVPHSRASFRRFRQAVLPAWRHTLQVDWPLPAARSEPTLPPLQAKSGSVSMDIPQPANGGKISVRYFAAAKVLEKPTLVVLAGLMSNADLAASSLPAKLVSHGMGVLLVLGFSTGEPANQFDNFYTTYNRTLVQSRVLDLLSVCAEARRHNNPKAAANRVVLCGDGPAGLWSLLAAPGADAVIADCDALDATSDEALLAPVVFCPGIRNIGTFEGAAMLAAPHPLLLHNTGTRFPTDGIRSAYWARGQKRRLRIEREHVTDAEIVQWISSLK